MALSSRYHIQQKSKSTEILHQFPISVKPKSTKLPTCNIMYSNYFALGLRRVSPLTIQSIQRPHKFLEKWPLDVDQQMDLKQA